MGRRTRVALWSTAGVVGLIMLAGTVAWFLIEDVEFEYPCPPFEWGYEDRCFAHKVLFTSVRSEGASVGQGSDDACFELATAPPYHDDPDIWEGGGAWWDSPGPHWSSWRARERGGPVADECAWIAFWEPAPGEPGTDEYEYLYIVEPTDCPDVLPGSGISAAHEPIPLNP